MNTSFLYRRLHWLNLPGMLLLMLLQRTPVLRLASAAQEAVAASPIAVILRSAFAAVASLGAMHSLAGATQFVQSPSGTVAGTVGASLEVAFTYNGTPSPPQSFLITGGSLPPGMSFIPAASGTTINSGTPVISGTPSQAGAFTISVQGFNGPGGTGFTNGVSQTIRFNITGAAATTPVIVTQPSHQTVSVGGTVTLTVAATGTDLTYQWQRNGTNVGSGGSTLAVNNVQPGDIGFYRVTVANSAGSVTSQVAVVGLSSSVKLVGPGMEFSDIPHQNGNIFDQILIGGPAVTVTADPSQVLRASYVDGNNDIVQVEFSGPGALSISIEGPGNATPALPESYNQNTQYVKGHATIVVTGATELTNLTVFSVGRATALNQALFKDIPYHGRADIAAVAILSANGQFGGMRGANAVYSNDKSVTGLYAPNVSFANRPCFTGDIDARDSATPILMIGSGSDTRVNGGDFAQSNSRAIQTTGLTELRFTPGQDSHGNPLPAQQIQGQLEENGANVTSRAVFAP